MGRLIDADALDEILMDFASRYREGRFNRIAEGLEDARKVLYAMPTIEAEPVRHGRWVCLEAEIGYFTCSECDHRILRAKCNYCPNCGAKMDKEDE